MENSAVKPVKILVIYENGAGGHRAAARAIGEALTEHPGVQSTILEMDTLAPKSRKQMYSAFMDIRAYFRPIVRFGFQWAMKPNPVFNAYRKLDAIIQPWSLRKFPQVVAAEAPDLIVSTHFRPTAACNTWLARGVLRTPVHVLVPDYMAHGMYAGSQIGQYYVASEEVRQDLIRQGVEPERILITGLPVSRNIARAATTQVDRAALKRQLGLRPDLPVVLFLGGARGDQEYSPILSAFERRHAACQVVILCGWNTAMREDIERYCAHFKLPVHVIGFQSNMVEWYQAADVLLTKPGGMTTAEALAMSKPMVYVSPHPGKEEMQAARLTDYGVAYYLPTIDASVDKVIALLSSTDARQRMDAAISQFRRDDPGAQIAAAVVKVVRPQLLT